MRRLPRFSMFLSGQYARVYHAVAINCAGSWECMRKTATACTQRNTQGSQTSVCALCASWFPDTLSGLVGNLAA